MSLRRNMVMIALAASVAGASLLVLDPYRRVAAADRLPDPLSDSAQSATGPKVLYDATALPVLVQRILKMIIVAAQSGDIEEMRPVLESNELKPMVAAKHVDDPIAYWKKHSVDGSGRDILADMLNMLSTGSVLTGKGYDAMYVWPYFAETDLRKLTPRQQVELYRMVPPERAAAMMKTGKYTGYRLGVSPAGVWHYFSQ